jgi:hypothetical protein
MLTDRLRPASRTPSTQAMSYCDCLVAYSKGRFQSLRPNDLKPRSENCTPLGANPTPPLLPGVDRQTRTAHHINETNHFTTLSRNTTRVSALGVMSPGFGEILAISLGEIGME